MDTHYYTLIGSWCGFVADQLWGDPKTLPHPVVAFGKTITFGEKLLNNGRFRLLKGVLMTIILVTGVFGLAFLLMELLGKINLPDQSSFVLRTIITSIVVFYCLSARTLRREVRMVFEAVDQSTEAGRKQLSRIVGRDTSALNPQQIRTAALETLAENLSDGIIAPLFWFALLGVPGMLTYKMINTLDSMIGYKNERYYYFGKFAARLDDIVNYIPARITGLFMLVVGRCLSKIVFVAQNGRKHASPNSGYPEAALAGILNCRFGGPNYYFDQLIEKPYIGTNDRLINNKDMKRAIGINQYAEWLMLIMISVIYLICK